MDYESSNGSQFSLREVWTEYGNEPVFKYTTVSAYVDGSAYVAKLSYHADEVDEVEILTNLEPVPPECIHPKFQEWYTIAPDFDSTKHYLKAPSFTYDDCQPGRTFVADCMRNEVCVLERLKFHPHPNIVSYLGCVVKDGRITHICLEKYPSNLVGGNECVFNERQSRQIIDGIFAGLEHLHGLGLAHNDINPENICLDAKGEPIILDFDGCLPFGQKLIKGEGAESDKSNGAPVSSKDNDLILGMDSIYDFIDAHTDVPDSSNGNGEGANQYAND